MTVRPVTAGPVTVQRLALALALALLSAPGPVAAQAGGAIREFAVTLPRDFGYSVGDLIEHRVVLTLNAPYRLDRATLPPAGRLDRWLWFFEPEVDERPLAGAIRYELRLRYQLINLPPPGESRELGTPTIRLGFRDDQGRFSTALNGWRFRVVGLTDPQRRDLRPDRPPPPAVPARRAYYGLAGAGLAGALAGLLWLHLLRPWRQRRQHPFLRAQRELARLAAEPAGPARYRRALAAVQRAFDRSAGYTLFGDRLPRFFAERPALAPLRQPIEHFFAHSRRRLFGAPGSAEPAGPDYTLDALAGLCRACYERDPRVARR